MSPDQIFHLLNFLLILAFILGFVAIVMWFKKKEFERKTQVFLTALEKGQTLRPDLFSPRSKDVNKYILLGLLVGGCGATFFAVLLTILGIVYLSYDHNIDFGMLILCALVLAVGLSLLLGYFKGKKMLGSQFDGEEKA